MDKRDVIIIGGGPGGYVAAIRAGQLGLKTTLIEKKHLGGMCLNWGCIPSKALIEDVRLFSRIANADQFGIEGIDPEAVHFNWQKALQAKDRIVKKLVNGVRFLMKKNSVEVLNGEGVIEGPGKVRVGDAVLETRHIIIATGSRPGREELQAVNPNLIVETQDFFSMENLPETIAVAGGNPAACELASMLRMAGRNVSIITRDAELLPFLDSSLKTFVRDKFKKIGIDVFTGREITGSGKGGIRLGKDFVRADVVLNSSDREPVLPRHENITLEYEAGFIRTDEHMRTAEEGIYAVGDVTGQIFAQTASAQGICAVNHIADIHAPVNYGKLPVNIYLDPEIASVGLSEEQAREAGIEFRIGRFPLTANGKALCEGNAEGFVKVIAEKKYGEVIGVHIAAARATDMIAEAVLSMKLESTLEDVAGVVHAHPTLNETFLEAGYEALDRPLHL